MTRVLFSGTTNPIQDVNASGAPLPIQSYAVNAYTLASAAQTATGTSAAFTTTAFQYLAIDITLTSFTGGTTPSVTFFVDRLGSDGVWYLGYASAAQSSATALSVAMGTVPTAAGSATTDAAQVAVLTQSARFRWTSTGTPTAITFSASIYGR